MACYDHDDSNDADLIGELTVSIPRMMEAQQAQVL